MTEQPYLDNFLEEEARARESSIPKETRQEYLNRMYWKFRKYECNNKYGLFHKIKAIEMIRGFMEKQR